MEKEIILREDVVKNIAKKTGHTQAQVDTVLKLLLHKTKYLVEETDCMAIMFPKIGTMYFKQSLLRKEQLKYIARVTAGNVTKIEKRIFDNGFLKLDVLHSYYKEYSTLEDKSSVRLVKGRLNHQVESTMENRYFTKGYPIKKHQELQNKFILYGEEIED